MSETTTPYVVSRGEHLLQIALRFGLEPDAIWNHPKNAELKKTREPDVLAPGDLLYLPKPPEPTLALAPRQSNRYRATVPKVTVRLLFVGDRGPYANESYELHGLGEVIEGATDPAGRLSVDVPVSARNFRVVFPARHLEHTIEIGGLDPVGTASGLRSRLAHLGFASPGSEEVSPEVLRAFQTAHALPPTGKADAATTGLLGRLAGR